MLAQIAEHSRIVDPTPSDDYVRQRREAIERLVSNHSLSAAILEAFVEFALFGVPSGRGPHHTDAANALISAIQESQPSFAADVDANQLDLRLVSAIVLGERIQTTPSDSTSAYLASLVIAASLLQPPPQGIHVARLVHDLVTLARTSLDDAGIALRGRRPWPNKSRLDISGSDVAAVAKSAKSALDILIEAVTINAKADHEELDVLWWLYGARSVRTGERFESMALGDRALSAAIELSDRMLMPPIVTAEHLLGSLVSDQTELSLTELVGQTTTGTLGALIEKKGGVDGVVEHHASLLPLSWLAARLVASDSSPGWQQEFERKTKLTANTSVTLGGWARQGFAECVTQRLALLLVPNQAEI